MRSKESFGEFWAIGIRSIGYFQAKNIFNLNTIAQFFTDYEILL